MGNDPSIEYLCDRFAASLLLPRKLLKQFLEQHNYLERFSIPPLHLIPNIANRYRITDQAVARRLFFQLFPTKLAILCIRTNKIAHDLFTLKKSNEESQYKLIWCALPAELQQQELVPDFRIPLKTYGKIIPSDMIPENLLIGETIKTYLDGRWWFGSQAQPKTKSKRPLKHLPSGEKREAFICMFNDIIYIALPF